MKKIFKTSVFFLWLLVTVAGCKKNELQQYEAPDMVYFYKSETNSDRDSTTYSFAIRDNNVMTDTVYLNVRIMGVAKNADREVALKVLNDSSTAVQNVHFVLLPYVVPAGAYSARLPVLVKRTPEMKNQDFRLLLEIVKSKDFLPGVPNTPQSGHLAGAGTKYLIVITDHLTQPSNWSFLTNFFGTYSQVKYRFIIDVTGRTEFPQSGDNALPYGEFVYYKALCKAALADYEALHGPLIDEFGAPVTFP